MIIACPACKTRYVVPDSAIGVEGRTVRCAKCKHSWFQDGPQIEVPPAAAAPPTAPAPETSPPPAPAGASAAAEDPAPESPSPTAMESGPESGPAPRPSVNHWRIPGQHPPEAAAAAEPQQAPAPPAFDTPVPRETEPAYPGESEEEPSQFDYEPPFRPRRNRLRLWTAAAAVFAVLALATAVGVSYWGLPEWVPVTRPTFGVNQPSLKLEFPPDQQDRRTLPNGTEYFGASGTITNVGRETVHVPPILIVMRDERERIVYNWEIVPPQPRLAPGETISVKEAVTDVPRAAKYAEIGWKPD